MKKLLLITLALVIAAWAFAQTDITIGTGTSTGRYPFNDYFVYSRSQCIYLESEIGYPGTIHKLRWYRSDTGADPNAIGTTQIWLKTVPNAVFADANWEDPGTLVYEIANIDLGAGGGWYEVDITDFNYTGGNLVVSVYTQDAPYTTPHSYWYYTATTGYNRCRLGNSDSTNPPTLSLSTSRPNIQINMTTSDPTSAPNPAVLVSPGNGAWAMIGDILSWNSGGGFPSSYDVYFGTSSTPPLVSDNQTTTTYTPTLTAGNTYYWKVVPANAFGEASDCPTWSFKTPTATQLAESFENTSFPPAGWANPGTWSRSTSYAKHGTASANKYGSTSTQYILSTPKVTITGTSTLDLWTLCSTITGTLQIVYSPDRTTWTQIGSNITHAATYTWYNTVVDLSSLAGNNYYLGIRTGLQSASYYVDLVIGPEITPEAPGAPTLSTPADLATNVNVLTTFSWTAPTTGGVPTGYKLYCDTNNPPTTLKADLNALTYTLTTPLAYNTTYYWTVLAYNGTGNGPTATVRSFTTRTDPTIYTFPYTAGDFETGSLPLNWVASEGVAGASYHWNVSTGAASHGPAAPHSGTYFGWLYCYLANSTYNPYYLTTPPIALDATAKRLTYWYWIGTDTYTNPLFVEISTDNQATWTTLYTHSNTSNTLAWYQNTISLETYASTTVYLRFKGMSNYGNGMTDLGLDDIIVEDIPAAPIISCTPTSWDFGQVILNTTKTKDFTICNIGGGTLSVSSIVIAGNYYTLLTNPAPVDLTAGQTAIFTVQYAPTALGNHNGTVTITDNRGTTIVNLSAVCYDPTITSAQLPYSNGFEETWTGTPPAPVLGWTVINADNDSYTWRRGPTYIDAHTGDYIAQGMGNTDDWLITPPIQASEDLRIKWWDAVESATRPNTYTVLVSTTDNNIASFTNNLGTFTCNWTTWTEHTLNLDAFTDNTIYIAFHQTASGSTVWDFGIDDFLLEAIPAAPIFSYTPTSINFGLIQQNLPATPVNVTVTNTGGGTLNLSSSDISITGPNAAMFSFNPANLPAALDAGQSVIIPVSVTVTQEGPVSATLTITYNGTPYNVALSAEGLPAGIVIIGNGTSDLSLPIEPFYGYTYSQSIFLQSELNMVNQRIEKIWYHWNGAAEATHSNNWTIYMGHTTNTSLADGTSWIPLSNLTQVFTGEVALPATAGWIEIMLTSPFVYNNTDNLVIAVDENEASYDGSSEYFYCTSATTARSIRYYNDNTNPDPATPPTGTMVSGYPNIMLKFDEIPTTPAPVTLIYPANGATLLPTTGFNLQWAPDLLNGLQPDYYAVYLSQDEDAIFDTEFRFETSNTHFNPVTEGGITFNYLERWYWTVEAFVGEISAVVEPPFMFTITPQPGILGVNPTSLNQTLTLPDAITATQQLTLSNTGALPLTYQIIIEETTARGSSIVPPEQMQIPIANPEAANYCDNAPVQGPLIESQSRILFDLQFYYPTQVNDGEYGIVCDGNYFYVSVWNAASFHKYDLSGNYLETFSVTGVPSGLRDLTYDGTYFYGAATTATIYQMDFNTHTLIGTITAPSGVRGIAYDEDNDAFWVTSNWSSPLYLVSRTGETLQTLTTAATSMGGLAWDNLSGPEPTLWANTQTGTHLNTLVQIDLNDGSVLQSFNVDATVVPGLPATEHSAGGLCIAKNLIPGTATLVAMAQNYAFYGLELCNLITWLSAEPGTGTLSPGETPAVTVSFDASGLDLGTYSANLTFTHNGENEPVVVPVTMTVGGIYPAVFSITPDVAVDFGTIEQMNPVVQTFTITNTGGSGPTPLIIPEDGIYLTTDTEHNFVIDAPGLPVSLGHNETYEFTVSFIPQTIGEKTATLNILDNLSAKVLHTIALSGTAIAEQIYIPVNLTATVTEQDVRLTWANYSGIPGSPGWLSYDDGTNYDGIGTGSSGTFDVAIRFDSGTMYGYADMELSKVKYFPRSANTTYTIKVWTGNDGTLTPSTLVYSQAHTPTVNQWNEVVLNTPIPISGTQALWIGYECVVATGADYYPAGCDAGPAVVGYGDLISLGTWESMATGYGLDYNWNLQGYFDIPTLTKAPKLLSIPVINQELRSKEHLAVRFTTSGNSNPPNRVLRGYNIYRNAIQINTLLVPTATYLDQGVPYGTYSYTVQGVYYTALSPMSDPVIVNVEPPIPYSLPFIETWSSADFATNQWNTTAANWIIDSGNGLEEPSAAFSWSPQITDYQEYLTSWYLDATGISNVKFKFDMALNNYSIDAENLLIPQVWDGTSWQTIDTFSSFDNEGDGYDWDTYVYDISAYASNRMFRIRFLAAGEDSYEINYWYIDNIVVEVIPTTLPQPTLAIDYDGTYVNLTWDTVPGTDWYLIYSATDPYGAYNYLGYWPASYGTALSLEPNSKEFYQIKACSMELPDLPLTKRNNVFTKKMPNPVLNRK